MDMGPEPDEQQRRDQSFAEQGIKAYFAEATEITPNREARTITFKLRGSLTISHEMFCEERRGLQLGTLKFTTEADVYTITTQGIRFPPIYHPPAT